MEHRVYLGLGSNQGDRMARLQAGLEALAARGILVEQVSRWRETAPAGGPPQGPYLNGAARVRTGLEPMALLEVLKEIERASGREPGGPRWGPRSLDLDILLYDDITLRSPELTIPHPRMCLRAFVLEPLVEVLE